MTVCLRSAKAAAAEDFPLGHPGREALLALPDNLPEGEFYAILPSLIRLIRVSRSVGEVLLPADAGGDRRGGTAAHAGDRDL